MVELPFLHRKVAPDAGAKGVGGGGPKSPDAYAVLVGGSEVVAGGSKEDPTECGEGHRRSGGVAEVPHVYGVVKAGGGEAVAVGCKGDGVNIASMLGEHQRGSGGLAEVPHAYGGYPKKLRPCGKPCSTESFQTTSVLDSPIRYL